MLDVEGIQKLAIDVVDPVLVVGAGQGLLVEQLHQKGFKADGVDLAPQMIKYAKERRNIDLIHADARKLPFADGSYKTCIVATGVVDFMGDEKQIASIVDEVQRVTGASGKILLAFYRFHPRVERLMKYIGTITDTQYWQAKRTYRYMNMNPREFFAALREESKVSVLGAICTYIECQMFLPRKEKRSTRNWNLLWKKVRQEKGGADAIIEVTPELLPYRLEPQIRSLFERLGQPIHRVYPYDSCTVVLLAPKAR
jgi:ubiquinone/menaquinone biosynthesis C-methylase UbiE